jgi:hypothetical protein
MKWLSGAAISAVVPLVMMAAAPTAIAQEEPAPTPTEVTCYPLLSSLICEVPINVGPFVFDIDVPVEFDSVFPPSSP